MADDDLEQALADLIATLEINRERIGEVIERAHRIQARRAQGLSWSEIVSEQDRPLIVEMLSQNLAALSSAGSRVRRQEAKALHDEGLSMERIGQLFGVTRQRVSELLRHERRAPSA